MSNKIRWWKLESHFGAGHQSTKITYLHTRGEVSNEDLQDMEDTECQKIAGMYFTNCTTSMIQVDTIPKEEKEDILSCALSRIRHAEREISALESLT